MDIDANNVHFVSVAGGVLCTDEADVGVIYGEIWRNKESKKSRTR